MKKQSIIFVMLLLVVGAVAAQDTIQSNQPRPNYFFNHWLPNDTALIQYFESTLSWSHLEYLSKNSLLNAKYFFTEDSLTIHGIAVMMDLAPYDTNMTSIKPYVADSSTKDSYEYFSIYRAGPEHPEPYSDSLRIHFFDDSPAYYLRMHLEHELSNVEIYPVWEVYFQEPYVVNDSFYLAATSTSHTINNTGIYEPYSDHWPFVILGFLPYPENGGYFDQPWPEKTCSYLQDVGWICDSMGTMLFFFPILTPEDTTIVDTTIVDTTIVDTVGIGAVQLVERYVHLMPNPASERVTVTSSFGLRQVELYDAAGARVLNQRLTGYSASLDISALPSGTYLARIVTPSGAVAKKLIVQRK